MDTSEHPTLVYKKRKKMYFVTSHLCFQHTRDALWQSGGWFLETFKDIFFPCPLTQPVTCRAQKEESDEQTAAGRVGLVFPPPSPDSHSFRRNELQDFSQTAAAAAALKVVDLLRHKNKQSSNWEKHTL